MQLEAPERRPGPDPTPGAAVPGLACTSWRMRRPYAPHARRVEDRQALWRPHTQAPRAGRENNTGDTQGATLPPPRAARLPPQAVTSARLGPCVRPGVRACGTSYTARPTDAAAGCSTAPSACSRSSSSSIGGGRASNRSSELSADWNISAGEPGCALRRAAAPAAASAVEGASPAPPPAPPCRGVLKASRRAGRPRASAGGQERPAARARPRSSSTGRRAEPGQAAAGPGRGCRAAGPAACLPRAPGRLCMSALGRRRPRCGAWGCRDLARWPGLRQGPALRGRRQSAAG